MRRLYIHGDLEKSPDSFGGREIRNLRVTKQGDQYFCIFTIRHPDAKKRNVKKIIALDPNHKNLVFGVGTGGQAVEIKNPYFLKTIDRRIDQLKSLRERCK